MMHLLIQGVADDSDAWKQADILGAERSHAALLLSVRAGRLVTNSREIDEV